MTYEDVVSAWRDRGYKPEDYPKVLKNVSILLAYNSSKLENLEIEYDDVYSAGTARSVYGFDKQSQTLIEIRNAHRAFDCICEALKAERTLDEDLALELQELLDEMAEVADDKDSLSINNTAVAAAYFHAKFESIHPFADGNGRTGRLLMNYHLLSFGCPPAVIAADRHADRYYEALKSYSTLKVV